jgi:Na+/H+-translocating membrane pyrophosphatase
MTSILAGYIGMMVAVFSNARTTVSAKKEGEEGWKAAFNCAFRAGLAAPTSAAPFNCPFNCALCAG